jgi:hypothetical protein
MKTVYGNPAAVAQKGETAPALDDEPVATGNSFYNRLFGTNPTFLGSCLNKQPYQPLKRGGDGDIGAGHVGRYLSLANPDRASAMVCHVPAGIVFGILITYAFWLYMNISVFIYLFIVLAGWIGGWSTYMSICTYIGVQRVRRWTSIDWGQQWEDHLARNPGCDDGMLHFVIIPNYDEDEEMLAQTIQNVANNQLAQKYMIVVLDMEAREG